MNALTAPTAYQQAQDLLQADSFEYWAAIKLLRDNGLLDSPKNPKKDQTREMLLLIPDERQEQELTQEQKDFFYGQVETYQDLQHVSTGYVDSCGNPIYLLASDTEAVEICDRVTGNTLKTMPRAIFEANKHLLATEQQWQEQHQDKPVKTKEKAPKPPKSLPTVSIAPATTTVKKQVKTYKPIKAGSKLETEINILRQGATKQQVLDALDWKCWSHSRSAVLCHGYGIRRDEQGLYWLIEREYELEIQDAIAA